MFRPAVVRPFPVTACFHKSGVFEMREMTRHFRLHYAQGIGQFADTGFAAGQQVQQTQPRRIGQNSKEEDRFTIFRG